MNLFPKQKQTHRQKKETYGYHGKSGGNRSLGLLDTHIPIYKTDKKQGPIVQHRELYSISYNNL